jgi:hypothetical protein
MRNLCWFLAHPSQTISSQSRQRQTSSFNHTKRRMMKALGSGALNMARGVLGLLVAVFAVGLVFVRLVYTVLPIAVLIHLVGKFLFGALDGPPTQQEYQLLFTSIGLSATLCGLVLRLASTGQDEARKAKYYEVGENLFYGTLLFVMTLALRYSNVRFSEGSEWLIRCTRVPIAIVGSLTISSASLLIYSAIIGLDSQMEKLDKDFYRRMLESGVMKSSQWMKKLAESMK